MKQCELLPHGLKQFWCMQKVNEGKPTTFVDLVWTGVGFNLEMVVFLPKCCLDEAAHASHKRRTSSLTSVKAPRPKSAPTGLSVKLDLLLLLAAITNNCHL